MISLHIVYQDETGKAISAAKVNDKSLLLRTAERAIYEMQDRAKEMRKLNPLFGRFGHRDAKRLEKLLTTLIPELEQASRKKEKCDPHNNTKEINHA